MQSLNQCNFIGNLGSDVESRAMPNGQMVANFTIAVSDDYKDKQTGQLVDKTEWVRITAYGKLAEICIQYLAKGSKVYISGKMQTRSWEQDGVKKYSTEINANQMQMLDTRQNAQNGAGAQTGQSNSNPSDLAGNAGNQQKTGNFDPNESFDDDIPF